MAGCAFGITAAIGAALISALCIVAKTCGLLPAIPEDEDQ